MSKHEQGDGLERLEGEDMAPLIPLRPSLMVAISVMARYVLGSLLLVGLGAIYVPEGEFDQYVVSHSYAIHSLTGWVGMTICAAVGYGCLRRVLKGRHSQRVRHNQLFSKGWFDDKKNMERITGLCIATGLVQLLFIIIAIVTGSEDRGSMYDYWARQDWKPTSLFISIERLFSIFYCLAPIAFVKNGWKKRVVMGCLYTVLTVTSFSLSGRGAFLYPLVYTLVGMAAVVRRVVLLRLVLGFALMVTLLVPGMAAIRDLPSYESYGSTNIIERAILYIRPSSYGENMKRRIFAFGREVYACSDGFVYRDAGSKRYGFGDISIKEITRLALPRIIGGHNEKMDGSRIAQEYMGVKKDTWFPCITLQGDLFRRGGPIAIAIGGMFYGGGLYMLDRYWVKMAYGNKMFNIIMTLLPITLLKAAPTGTVREVISFATYEIMKYTAVAWALTFLESRIRGVSRINLT